MTRPRVVTRYQAAIGSTNGRPIPPEHRRRIDALISDERYEYVQEPDPEKMMKALETAEFFLTYNGPLPAGLFERAKRLRHIQVGTHFGDKIDIEAAARAGVAVSFFPRPITDSVADHSMALLLIMVRSMPQAVRNAHEGSGQPLSPTRPDGSAYNWTQLQGVLPLRGMRLGILGMGEISRATAVRASAFGMEVRYHNRSPLPAWIDERTGARPVGRDELFETSDVLFPAIKLNDTTRGLVGEAALRAMPKGSCVINVGRGPLINQDALCRALEDGHIAGAGLDVFDHEPAGTDHPLLRFPNVVPTPHVAGGDDESLTRELEGWLENVRRAVDGKTPRNIVNGVEWK